MLLSMIALKYKSNETVSFFFIFVTPLLDQSFIVLFPELFLLPHLYVDYLLHCKIKLVKFVLWESVDTFTKISAMILCPTSDICIILFQFCF